MSESIKIIASYLAMIPAFILTALMRLMGMFVDPERSFQSFSQFLALAPGFSGNYIRKEFYRLNLKACSANPVISFGTIFSSSEAEIGENVYIGPYSIIGRASIGDDTLIASRVSLMSGLRQHNYSRTDIPIREQSGEFKKIIVGKDCWIGEGAVVGADVGAHSVIAAGSVVFEEVQELQIVRGNPAQLYKTRKKKVPNQPLPHKSSV